MTEFPATFTPENVSKMYEESLTKDTTRLRKKIFDRVTRHGLDIGIPVEDEPSVSVTKVMEELNEKGFNARTQFKERPSGQNGYDLTLFISKKGEKIPGVDQY
jgi:hypothetical protein